MGLVATVAVVVPAQIAWACVALVGFRVNGSGVVEPGGTVEVFGGSFASGETVEIRLDSPDGPVLAAPPLPESTMTGQFTLQVPIPADITPGQHFLVATQEHYDMNVGNTARAAIHVSSSPPAEPTPEQRPTTLAVSDAPGPARYILIGLGVAGAGVLLAAGASKIAGRPPSRQADGAQAS